MKLALLMEDLLVPLALCPLTLVRVDLEGASVAVMHSLEGFSAFRVG